MKRMNYSTPAPEQMLLQKEGFMTIPINPSIEQKVDPNTKIQAIDESAFDHWKFRLMCSDYELMDRHFEAQECWESDTNIISNGNFITAVLRAYNHHLNLQLMPDDIWFVVCLNFSKFVNEKTEELRELLVNHQGKMELVVIDNHFDGQKRWDDFFVQMQDKIKNNTKNNIVDTLQADFSTSKFFHKMLSSATIMSVFKEYFDYGRCVPACGIRNVLLGGTLNDWIRIREKLTKLKMYPGFESYVDGVTIIIDKFIESIKGNIDVNWWDKMINATRGSIGSGSTTYVDGWIINLFYGVSGRVDAGDLHLDPITVKVKVSDHQDPNKSGDVYVVGGFRGLNEKESIVSLVMSMMIISDLDSRSKKDES